MAWTKMILQVTQAEIDEQMEEADMQDISAFFEEQSMCTKIELYDEVGQALIDYFSSKVDPAIIKMAVCKVVREHMDC